MIDSSLFRFNRSIETRVSIVVMPQVESIIGQQERRKISHVPIENMLITLAYVRFFVSLMLNETRHLVVCIFAAFKTPEEFFLNEQPTTKFEWGSLNPREYVNRLDVKSRISTSMTYHKDVRISIE
jgi:hypothetical protein